MFPNPQTAFPLPLRPSVERYRKLATELVNACKSADENAIAKWSARWTRSFAKPPVSSRDLEQFASKAKGTLSGAHFVIAQTHGFASWQGFSKHLAALKHKTSAVSRFEAAAGAIVKGDISTLQRLLRKDPALVHHTSTREHAATLLHYVSANGVESFQQKTPANIVAIAELLLDAGAAIDARANVYGGCDTLGLVATSIHPERAGVQEALLQKLLDYGATFPACIVHDCLSNGRLRAAQFLAGRGASLNFAEAAGIGRLDLVHHQTSAGPEELLSGFLFACQYGHDEVVAFLLENDLGLAQAGAGGQSPLHRAVIGGHLSTVQLLLRYDAPLEVKNQYGGTPFGQALWSAAHGGDPAVYIAILEELARAGAQIPRHHVPVSARIDAWLAQHGGQAEASWNWMAG